MPDAEKKRHIIYHLITQYRIIIPIGAVTEGAQLPGGNRKAQFVWSHEEEGVATPMHAHSTRSRNPPHARMVQKGAITLCDRTSERTPPCCLSVAPNPRTHAVHLRPHRNTINTARIASSPLAFGSDTDRGEGGSSGCPICNLIFVATDHKAIYAGSQL